MAGPKRPIDSATYSGPDRRSNGNGDWTSLKAWANAIGIVGIPGAIAIFLVYVGATEIPKLVRNSELAILEIRQNRDVLREHITQTERLIRITERTCYNAAKDDNARQSCFDK